MNMTITAKMAIRALVVALTVAVVTSAAWAKDAINTNWRGLAIKGYDTVAYFTDGKPVKGKSDYEYKWQGARWRFANQEHLDMFKSDPQRYAPQYGGY
jgi:YHS domain-containing protein